MKDFNTKTEIARFDSSGDLYSIHGAPTAALPSTMLATVDLWHQRLGHPNSATLSSILSDFSIPCNKEPHNSSLCISCQQGKHVRLPFSSSSFSSTFPFELLHCDLWTSPILSISGFKYYLVILDDYTHFIWTFPLRNKSDTHTVLTNFQRYVATHFLLPIRFLQCDNGKEFNNIANRNLSSNTAFSFGSHVHTPHHKMAKLNALFAQSMILLEHFLSRHPCHPISGLKHCVLPLIF